MVLKNVIVVGASGNLGPTVLSQLLANPSLDITVLARPNSKLLSSPPPDLKNPIATAELTDEAALTKIFKEARTDAVVSLVASGALLDQKHLINAAIAAGVKRFLPSEFGSDLDNTKTGQLAVFRNKKEVQKYLAEKAAKGEIEYTLVSNGLFLDWCLKIFFLGVNPKAKTATFYDGGENRFSTTLLADIGTAVAGILTNPTLPETINKRVFIYSAILTQKQLLSIYEKVTGDSYKIENASTEDVEKQGNEKISKGDFSGFGNLIIRGNFAEGYGADYEGKDVSEKVGIRKLDEKGLEEVVRASIA